MKIATVLPTSYLFLESKSDYHLCLAHQVRKSSSYAAFFKAQVANGAFVIQDNGVVETGVPIPIEELVSLANQIECQEMVLPDSIYKSIQTLQMSYDALRYVKHKQFRKIRTMVVPQGYVPHQWIKSVRRMLTWDVDTIGISRFLVPKVFPSRLEALRKVPGLIASNKDIHLLGCPEHPEEIAEINAAFPGRIRGVDSGIAAIYAQEGISMNGGKKPDKTINLDAVLLDEDILIRNIRIWKEGCISDRQN